MTSIERDGFLISTDPARLDLDAIERLMRTTYWAPDRSRESIEKSIQNSLCFALYDTRDGRQVGLMRVVTDYATFAWLCDVIIDQSYRGRGLGKWMLEVVLADDRLQPMSRWLLATADAHDLYRCHGFEVMAHSGIATLVRRRWPPITRLAMPFSRSRRRTVRGTRLTRHPHMTARCYRTSVATERTAIPGPCAELWAIGKVAFHFGRETINSRSTEQRYRELAPTTAPCWPGVRLIGRTRCSTSTPLRIPTCGTTITQCSTKTPVGSHQWGRNAQA